MFPTHIYEYEDFHNKSEQKTQKKLHIIASRRRGSSYLKCKSKHADNKNKNKKFVFDLIHRDI